MELLFYHQGVTSLTELSLIHSHTPLLLGSHSLGIQNTLPSHVSWQQERSSGKLLEALLSVPMQCVYECVCAYIWAWYPCISMCVSVYVQYVFACVCVCHDPAQDLLILIYVFPLFCPVLCFCSLCLLPWLSMFFCVYFLCFMCSRCLLCLCSRPSCCSLVCLVGPCPPVSCLPIYSCVFKSLCFLIESCVFKSLCFLSLVCQCPCP